MDKIDGNKERVEIVKLVPVSANKILDVGCGFGDVGLALKRRGECEVTGVEIDKDRADAAKKKIDKVLVENIEENDLPFQEAYFDCIIFADVLEHLRTPLDVLKKMKKYLKQEGIIIASLPNVRHLSVLHDLVLKGDWEYEDFGLLDKGHVRFFTKKSMKRLFQEADLTLLSMDKIFSIKGSKYFNSITAGLFSDFLAAQYVCCLKKGELNVK